MGWGEIIWFSILAVVAIQRIDDAGRRLREINAVLRGNRDYRAD